MASEGSICALILAAGKGTRMKSSLPKVLHPLAGRPVLSWVTKAVKDAGIKELTLVLSPDTSRFKSFLDSYPSLRVAIQNNQKGTGDAVASAACAFSKVAKPNYADGVLMVGTPIESEWTLVVTGDTPAISAQTLQSFIASTLESGKRLSVLGMNVQDPRGYGRLVKDSEGGLSRIVEERDADPDTKKVTLCNSGIVMAKTRRLFELLTGIAPHNAQNEYYLTDIFSVSAKGGESAHVFETSSAFEFAGVNDRRQLEALEEWLLDRRMGDFMTAGVTIHRPRTVYIEAEASLEQDVEVFPGVCVLGGSKISRGVQLGAGCVIEDAQIGAGAVIGANCVLTRMSVMAGSHVPPGTVRTEMNF